MENAMEKSELYDVLGKMKDCIGADDLLQAITMAMSSNELQDNLEYINRVYDLNLKEFD